MAIMHSGCPHGNQQSCKLQKARLNSADRGGDRGVPRIGTPRPARRGPLEGGTTFTGGDSARAAHQTGESAPVETLDGAARPEARAAGPAKPGKPGAGTDYCPNMVDSWGGSGTSGIGEMLLSCRSLAEYRGMFALSDEDLSGRVLDCPGGAASFTADAAELGCAATACDPVYQSADPAHLAEHARR